MNQASGGETSAQPFDEVFVSLPPFDSAEYLDYLRTAATNELPPEVLARAYRLLAGNGNPQASRATLARLLGDKRGRPEYLQPLLYLARQSVPPHQHWQDAQDLYHDALTFIIEALPKPQGRFAERAWTSFCYQRLRDAWRKRQGRRGERLEPARAEPRVGDVLDLLDRAVPPPWHGTLRPERLEWLEGFIGRTLKKIPDPFIRGVAEDQWVSGVPSPISGKGGTNGRKPLTERFGKSRFQVHRALGAARARLLAALETQTETEIDLDWFRGKLNPTRDRD